MTHNAFYNRYNFGKELFKVLRDAYMCNSYLFITVGLFHKYDWELGSISCKYSIRFILRFLYHNGAEYNYHRLSLILYMFNNSCDLFGIELVYIDLDGRHCDGIHLVSVHRNMFFKKFTIIIWLINRVNNSILLI